MKFYQERRRFIHFYLFIICLWSIILSGISETGSVATPSLPTRGGIDSSSNDGNPLNTSDLASSLGIVEEKAVLKVNVVNFRNSLSRKLFRTLIGESTLIRESNSSNSLENAYNLNSNPKIILYVDEESATPQNYDITFLYVDHALLMNEELLLSRVLEALHSLNISSNRPGKSLLRIFLNGRKESYNQVLNILNEAFQIFYDAANPQEIFSQVNITAPITQFVNPLIYLAPFGSEKELKLSSQTIRSIIDAAANITTPFSQFQKQQQQSLTTKQDKTKTPSKSSKPTKSIPIPKSKWATIPADLSKILKDAKEKTIVHSMKHIVTFEIRKELVENYYRTYKNTYFFGQWIDKIYERSFDYFHSLLRAHPELSDYLTLPTPPDQENSLRVHGKTTNNNNNNPHKELQELYEFHCYELYSILFSTFQPFYDRQLGFLMDGLFREYQNEINHFEIPVTLELSKDLENHLQNYCRKFQQFSLDLLPKNYYHLIVKKKSAPHFLAKNTLLSTQLKNKAHPFLLQWKYDKSLDLFTDQLQSLNNHVLAHYKSRGILPYRRMDPWISISFHTLFYHPFNIRDHRQDVLLQDWLMKDQLIQLHEKEIQNIEQLIQQNKKKLLRQGVAPTPAAAPSSSSSSSSSIGKKFAFFRRSLPTAAAGRGRGGDENGQDSTEKELFDRLEQTKLSLKNILNMKTDELDYYKLSELPSTTPTNLSSYSSYYSPSKPAIPLVQSGVLPVSTVKAVVQDAIITKFGIPSDLSTINATKGSEFPKDFYILPPYHLTKKELLMKNEFIREMFMLPISMKGPKLTAYLNTNPRLPEYMNNPVPQWGMIPTFLQPYGIPGPWQVDDFDRFPMTKLWRIDQRNEFRRIHGPERYIRWDVPPLDEVYENLRAVEEQHAKEFPPPFLDKLKQFLCFPPEPAPRPRLPDDTISPSRQRCREVAAMYPPEKINGVTPEDIPDYDSGRYGL